MVSQALGKGVCSAALIGGLLVIASSRSSCPVASASTTAVNLGQASTYAVLSGASSAKPSMPSCSIHHAARGPRCKRKYAAPPAFPPVWSSARLGWCRGHRSSCVPRRSVQRNRRPDGKCHTCRRSGSLTLAPGLYSGRLEPCRIRTVIPDAARHPNAMFIFASRGGAQHGGGRPGCCRPWRQA